MTKPLSLDDRVFVLTGAGISAESGLPTFRGADGLWRGHRVEEVATPAAFHANPELVWQFYSERRKRHASVTPNSAHRALAELEHSLGDRFFLCTQNVDSLHARGLPHRSFRGRALVSHPGGNSDLPEMRSAVATAYLLVRRSAVRHGPHIRGTEKLHPTAHHRKLGSG